MTATAFLPLLSCFINLYLFAYVAGQRQKNPVNQSYLLFSFMIFIVCLLDFLRRLPISLTAETAVTHIILSLIFFLGFLFTNFTYSLINKRRDIFYGLIAIAIPLAALLPFVLYGKFFVITGRPAAFDILPTPLFPPVFFVCAIIPGLYTLLLYARCFSGNDTSISRKQIALVFWGALFSLVYESVLLVFLPFIFSIKKGVELGSFGIVIQSLFIYWSIRKYNLFTVDIDQIQRVSLHIFENIKEAILLFDKEGGLLQANGAAAALFHPDAPSRALLEQRIADYAFDREYANLQTTLRGDGNDNTILVAQSLIRQTGKTLARIVIIRDITEQTANERELYKINRIESLGALAGGIAHDFNNYLTGIRTTLGLLKSDGMHSDDAEQIIGAGETAVHRASQLTRRLLTFARGDAPDMGVHSLRGIVEEVLSFTLHGSKTRYRIDIPDTLMSIVADNGQISQVLQNLAINADQAMPAGGTITVAARNRSVNNGDTLPLPPGEYVMLTFTDEGTGIHESIIDRIFDPYFTTKPEGSGLGLAIVYSIIGKHRGYIAVTSRVGDGTTFTLYLKASAHPALPQTKTPAKRLKGNGKILVMDDDPIIRLLLKKVLQNMGFSVELAENGECALALHALSVSRGERYAAVIVDLTVPGGMGGKELGEKLLQYDPAMKIIVASGYSQDPILVNFKDFNFSAAIRKPYSVDEIGAVLFDTLTTPAANTG